MANPIIRQKLNCNEVFVAPGLQDMIAAAIWGVSAFERGWAPQTTETAL